MSESIPVYRKDPDGTVQLIGFADGPMEIGIVMDEDRKKNDFADAVYGTDQELLRKQ